MIAKILIELLFTLAKRETLPYFWLGWTGDGDTMSEQGGRDADPLVVRYGGGL